MGNQSSNAISLGDLNGDGTVDVLEGNGTFQNSEPNIIRLNFKSVVFRASTARNGFAIQTQELTSLITFPVDIADNTTFTYTAFSLPEQPLPANTAFPASPSLPFEAPITLTLDYKAPASTLTHSLPLYFWEEATNRWVDAAISCDPTSPYQRRAVNF